MENNVKKKVFISYRRADNEKGEVASFHKILEEKSQRTLYAFLDLKDMASGDFSEQIVSAIENGYCFIPIITKNYVKDDKKDENDWCMKELKVAIRSQKIIVPIFLCNANEINEQFDIHTTDEQKRTDFENIDKWDKKDLIKYLTIANGTDSITQINRLKTYTLIDSNGNVNTDCVSDTLKNIYNSFCDSKEIPHFHDLLEKQNNALQQVSIQSTSYSFDMKDYIDLGITGKPTKEEKEEAERKQEQDKQRSLSEFLPNLNSFSVDKFIEMFEKERYAVVTGDAGQGKSIFLKQVCQKLGKQAEEYGLSNKKLFPIYAEIKKIPLPKTNDDNYSFLGALAKASVIGITKEQIDTVLRNGKLCLILDAMDEVAPDTFDSLYDAIVKANIVNDCHILLSSRPGQKRVNTSFSLGVSVELFDETFRLWSVDNISDENFGTFVKNETLKNSYQDKDNNFIGNFSQKMKEKEEKDNKYKYMSRNPFMLKSIVLTYYKKDKLPENKVEAFDQAVNDLIEREKKGETHTFLFNKSLKTVMGYIAFKSYKLKDYGKDTFIDTNSTNEAIEKTIKNEDLQDEIYSFIDTHKLVDENGFSHDLFACYYCAFYLYRTLANKKNIDEWLKNINPNTDYWKEVVETLICLFELNADNDETRKILKTILKSMQTVVKAPDYDILCGAVSQFIDKEYNKPMAESVLIKGMLKRGERGIKSFDRETYKCSGGANPYEELFYYVVVHNFVLGLDKIYDENKGNNKLPPIQTHLYNELCKVLSKGDNSLIEKSVDDFTEQFAFASSKERCNKKNLKGHVKIDNKTKGIVGWEFDGYSGLTSITIPDSIESIGNLAFSCCSGLTSIEVSKGNTNYHSEGNCLIETESNFLLLGCKNSVIPDHVTIIGDYAFDGCSELTSITIPDSVTSIGMVAFYGCSGLTSIEVSKGNTYYHSEGNCIIKTQTNTLILGCKNSVIPKYVTEIGDYAFECCSGLTSITIPDSVESIGNSAFICCSQLTSIEVSKGNTYYHSEGNCIINTETNTLILGCKNSVIPKYVTEIGDYAFNGSTGLKIISIPDSVQSIGAYAFEACSGLTSITIPNDLQRIGYSAFHNCSGLTSISIPDSVKSIGWSAFYGCSGLTSISIPDSVTSIGDSAFWGCSALTSISIPDSVTSIEDWAFFFCENLKDIFYSGTRKQWKSIKGVKDCGVVFEICTIHCIDGDIES